ncbi:Hypothetical predicted protein [Octopus vulgaris]|uniref:Uncharacterized protein n=1 Tax=Octopus vulgaris TaxID=6645 RepID=A0AA36AHV6_OCTVU|nr:Hypothetical predicted protein [Octopus vulgaris]
MEQRMEMEKSKNEQMIKENNAFRESRFTQKQELDIPETELKLKQETGHPYRDFIRKLEAEIPEYQSKAPIHVVPLRKEEMETPEFGQSLSSNEPIHRLTKRYVMTIQRVLTTE